MDAILLAGGYGTRLRPLTYTRPKPLIPVAGRPMLEWVLDRLPKEVRRVVVAVNWKANELARYIDTREKRKGERFEFVVVKEDEPLGTGGACKNAESNLTASDFFVLNADIISTMDLDAVVRAHKANAGKGTISLKEVPQADVVNFGVVKPGAPGRDGALRIDGFVEKPKDPSLAPSRYINAGAYLLRREVLDLIPKGKLVSIEKEIFPHLIPQGFWGVPFEGTWIDVGDPVRLRAASQVLRPGFVADTHTRISPDAVVQDTLLGKDCHVAFGARLEGCVIGDRVTVNHNVRLKDCVIGDGEQVSQDHASQRLWSRPVPAGYPAQQVGNAL